MTTDYPAFKLQFWNSVLYYLQKNSTDFLKIAHKAHFYYDEIIYVLDLIIAMFTPKKSPQILENMARGSVIWGTSFLFLGYIPVYTMGKIDSKSGRF